MDEAIVQAISEISQLREVVGLGSVVKSGSGLECWSDLEGVLQEYAEELGLDIHVSNPHNSYRPPVLVPGRLQIYFYSAPGSSHTYDVASSLFGHTLVSGQTDQVYPPRDGLHIVDSNGNIAATFYGGTLYVHCDLPHGSSSSNNVEPIMRGILETFTSLLQISTEPAIQSEEESHEAFLQLGLKRLDNTLKSSRKQLNQATRDVESAEAMIRGAQRDEVGARKLLEKLRKGEDVHKEKYEGEFDNLCQLDGIEAIQISENKIYVYTGEIEINHSGSIYQLGRFKIEIDTYQQTLYCRNLTRKQGGYDHPHISGGSCCLGNISGEVTDLLRQHEYYRLIGLMMAFLLSVNPSGWYVTIGNWPKK